MHTFTYGAFLSYSRNDKGFVTRLHRHIDQFDKRWFRKRSMRVFRDEVSQAANADLWGVLRNKLDASRTVVLVASLASVRSRSVKREIGYAIRSRRSWASDRDPAGDLRLPTVVLLDGKLPWTDGIDPNDAECAIPVFVYREFQRAGKVPIVVDLRPFRNRVRWLLPFRPGFVSGVAAVASQALGKDKDEIYGSHISRQRLTAAASAVIGLLIVALGFFGYRQWEAATSERQNEQLARAGKLRERGRTLTEQSRFDEALVAIAQARELDQNAASFADLLEARSRAKRIVWTTPVPFEGLLGLFALSPDSTSILGSGGRRLGLYDLVSGKTLRLFDPADAEITALAFGKDGRSAWAGARDGHVYVWDTSSGAVTAEWKAHDHPVQHLVVCPDGSVITHGAKWIRRWLGSRQVWQAEPTVRRLTQLGVSETRVLGCSAERSVEEWSVVDGRPLAIESRSSTALTSGGVLDMGSGRAASYLERRSGEKAEQIDVWSISSGESVGTCTLPARCDALCLAAGGKILLAGDRDGNIRAVDVERNVETWATTVHPGGRIVQISLLGDGKTIVASGSSFESFHDEAVQQAAIHLLTLDDGKLLRRFAGHVTPLRAVAFSPDGQTIVTGGVDGMLRFHSALDGSENRCCAGHDGAVLAVAFRPDGEVLASGGADGTVRLTRVETGETIRVLQGHSMPVACVAFHPEGGLLASADGMYEPVEPPDTFFVRVWNCETGEALREPLAAAANPITSLDFHPSGERLAWAGMDNTITVWDLREWRQVARHEHTPRAVRGARGSDQLSVVGSALFMPGGAAIAAGFGNGTIQIRSVEGEDVLRQFSGHPQPVSSLACAHDGRLLVTGAGLPLSVLPSTDDSLRVWDVQEGREALRLGGFVGGVAAISLSPDGEFAAVVSRDLRLRLVDLRGVTDPRRYSFSMFDLALRGGGDIKAIHPARPEALVQKEIRSASRLVLVDLQTRTERVVPLDVGEVGISGAVFSADGKRLLLDMWSTNDYAVLDTVSLEVLTRIEEPAGSVEKYGFVAEGQLTYFLTSRSCEVRDATSGLRILELPCPRESTLLAVMPSGKSCLLANNAHELEIWSLATRELVNRSPRLARPVAVAVSDAEDLIAVATDDGGVSLWHVPDARLEILDRRGYQHDAIGLSRDGELLAVADREGEVQVWHAPSLTLLGRVVPAARFAEEISFDPDGRQLLLRDALGSITVTNVEPLRQGHETLSRLTATECVDWARRWTRLDDHPDRSSLPLVWLTESGQPPQVFAAGIGSPTSAASSDRSPAVQRALEQSQQQVRGRFERMAQERQMAGTRSGETKKPLIEVLASVEPGSRRVGRMRKMAGQKWAELAAECQQALQENPDDLEALVFIGHAERFLAQATGDVAHLRTALEATAKAIDSTGDTTDEFLLHEAWRARSMALWAAGQPWEAMGLLRALHDDSPGVNFLYDLQLAQLLHVFGFYTDAATIASESAPEPGVPPEIKTALEGMASRCQELARLQQASPKLPAWVVWSTATVEDDGFRPNDVILKINGEDYDRPDAQLWQQLVAASREPGFRGHRFEVLRDGEVVSIETTQDLSGVGGGELVTPAEPLMYVSEVAEGQGKQLGLCPGDVIWSIAGQRVTTLAEVRAGLARDEPEIEVVVRRYRWAANLLPVLQRSVTPDGQSEARWQFEDLRLMAKPGLLGVILLAVGLSPPLRREPGEPVPAVPDEKPKPDVFHRMDDELVVTRSATDADMARLAEFDAVEKLSLSGNHELTEDGLACLASLPRLRELNLSRSRISNAGLAMVGRLATLTSLRLDDAKVSDTGLQHLAPLTRLETVSLRGTAITDAGLAIVSQWPELTSLDLSKTKIGDEGLGHLVSCSKLSQLRLAGLENLSIAGVRSLARLASLTEIDLQKTRLDGQALAALATCKGIRSLTLSGPDYRGSDLEAIAAMKGLTVLRLYGIPVADEDLRHLASLSSLETLRLHDSRVTGAGLVHIDRDLKVLSLEGSPVDDASITFVERFGQLWELSLAQTRVTERILPELGAFPMLMTLDLSSNNIHDGDLSALQGLDQLYSLDLSSTFLTDRSLPGLRQLPACRYIRLADSNVSPSGMEALEEFLDQAGR